MNALLSIIPKMQATELYKLTGDTLVDAELKAYAAGLNLIYERLTWLQRELFISTAQKEGLDIRELAFGPKRDYLCVEDRRKMLLYRNAVTVNDFDRESIQRALNAVGLETAIEENPQGKSLYINCIRVLDSTKTTEQMIQAAKDFLPAHLEVDFDFGTLFWNYLDNLNNTFEEMDGSDYTWNQIDSYGS